MEASLKETSYCPYVERTSTAIFSLTRQVQYLSIRNIQHDWVSWHLEKTMNNSTSIWDICLHLKRNTLDRHDCTCCTWSSFRPSILLCLEKNCLWVLVLMLLDMSFLCSTHTCFMYCFILCYLTFFCVLPPCVTLFFVLRFLLVLYFDPDRLALAWLLFSIPTYI